MDRKTATKIIDESPRILYISDINQRESIFHSQVLPQVTRLKKDLNLKLLVLTRGQNEDGDYSYPSIKGDFIRTLAYYNFLKNKIDLKAFILKNNFNLIYARGLRGGLLGSFIKKEFYLNKISLINDVRGDVLDENKENKIKKRLLEASLKFVMGRTDFIFTVSSFLKDKYHKLYHIPDGNIEVFPTFVPDNKFNFENHVRKEIRSTLNYKEDDLVILYSGNLAKWQNVDCILNAFSITNNPHLKLLILTKDSHIKEEIEHYHINQRRVHYLSVAYSEIQDYYFAADYGLLIRDNTDTNKSAAPTKFSEYVNSGLVVITTDIDADYVKLIKSRQINSILLSKKEDLNYIFEKLGAHTRNSIKINTLEEIIEGQKNVFSRLIQ